MLEEVVNTSEKVNCDLNVENTTPIIHRFAGFPDTELLC